MLTLHLWKIAARWRHFECFLMEHVDYIKLFSSKSTLTSCNRQIGLTTKDKREEWPFVCVCMHVCMRVCVRRLSQEQVETCQEQCGSSFPFPEWVCRWWVRNVGTSGPLCLQSLVTHSVNTTIIAHAFSRVGRHWRREVMARTGGHIWEMRAVPTQRPPMTSCFHMAGLQKHGALAGLCLGKGGLFWAKDKALAPLWQTGRQGCQGASRWARSEWDPVCIPLERERLNSTWRLRDGEGPCGTPGLAESQDPPAPSPPPKLRSTYAHIHMVLCIISGGSWSLPLS